MSLSLLPRHNVMTIARHQRQRIIGTTSTRIATQRCVSTQGQEAVCRLKEALEHYRIQNYQQTIPTRFKKDMIKGCAVSASSQSQAHAAVSPNTTTITTSRNNNTNEEAVASIEHLLRNIGVFGQLVSHADVAIIVKEQAAEQHDNAAIRADTILRQLL